MKTIVSKIIGSLTQDAHFPNWWKSRHLEIPFFNHQELPVWFMDYDPAEDVQFIQEADQALRFFLDMGNRDRLRLSGLVHSNCREFLEEVGYDEADQALWNIGDDKDIWQFVDPLEIHVARRAYNDRDIYLSIACGCAWEQEHGLQLVFRQGRKITRVSARDGHLTEADAYDKADEEDELLSQF